MKIGILSRKKELYSTRRLFEAIEKHGYEAMVIDPLRCYMNITSKKPMVYYREKALEDFDAIIPRIGASITFYGAAVLRQFEMMGVYVLNDSMSIVRARDKLRALQILSQKGIGLPVTGFAHSTQMTEDLIKMVGGAPLVIKLLEGTQGRGVILADTQNAAQSVIEAFRGLKEYFLVQEFIKEAAGCDLRCLVIGNKVVASMMRRARAGEFRSNLHRGGSAQAIPLSAEEEKVAIAAADAMGLNMAGVDLLRSKRGPLVMEVNSSPGLEGIESASKKDVAGQTIEYIEKNVKKKRKKSYMA